MTYRLTDGSAPGATGVEVVSDINLAGSLAQFGKGTIMQEVANRITAEFVGNFEQALSTATGTAAEAATSSPSQPRALDAGNLLWSVLRERFLALFRKRPG
jgi:hypothetical protein